VDYVSGGFLVGFMRGRAGQLGESGEYWMGMLRVVCFHIRSFKGGSPRLCRVRTTSVGPCCNKHRLCTNAYVLYESP
jgi:hypothetical protein